MGTFDIVLDIIYIAFAVLWTVVFLRDIKTVYLGFNIIGCGLQAVLCYMIPYIIVIIIAVLGIIRVSQHLYYITWGSIAMALSGIIGVGQSIFNQITVEDIYELIGAQVFNVYGQIWMASLGVAVILTILVYIKQRLAGY